MPVNQETIKKVLDDFTEDKFTDAKESLRREISKAKNDYLKDRLNLKKDPVPQDPEEGEEDDG